MVFLVQLENIWQIAEVISIALFPNTLLAVFTQYLSKIQLCAGGILQVLLIDEQYILVQNDWKLSFYRVSPKSFHFFAISSFLYFTPDISFSNAFYISEFESDLGNAILKFVCLLYIRTHLTFFKFWRLYQVCFLCSGYDVISLHLEISITGWISAKIPHKMVKHKLFVGKLLMNCLSVFDHFEGLAIEELKKIKDKIFQ